MEVCCPLSTVEHFWLGLLAPSVPLAADWHTFQVDLEGSIRAVEVLGRDERGDLYFLRHFWSIEDEQIYVVAMVVDMAAVAMVIILGNLLSMQCHTEVSYGFIIFIIDTQDFC
jgi:hypothetical protein